MHIVLIIIGAIAVGSMTESFVGIVIGAAIGFFLTETLKLRQQVAALKRRVDDLANKAPLAARDSGRCADADHAYRRHRPVGRRGRFHVRLPGRNTGW